MIVIVWTSLKEEINVSCENSQVCSFVEEENLLKRYQHACIMLFPQKSQGLKGYSVGQGAVDVW